MKTIKIGKELDYILSLQKRKDAKQRVIKVYDALLYKNTKANKKGYFQCPSKYLKKVNSEYTTVMTLLKEHKIIDFLSYNYDDKDIFDLRRKPFYNPDEGVSKSYKFLIDVELGYDYQIDTDFSKLYDNEKWYWKTRYSLLQLNFPPDGLLIKRDTFSRRLHTNITGNIGNDGSYKDLLSGGDYWTIDAKTCQPRLLWLHLKEIGMQDKKLNEVFENDLDFYEYVMQRTPSISDREEAKEVFTSWINGNGYIDTDKANIRDIFSTANTFIKQYKTDNYKNICRLLQYKEANIFIDDLLNNIDLEFCLTVHDSLIVKKEDLEYALDFCKSRHPEMVFITKEITKR
jgi:hypothetical protein